MSEVKVFSNMERSDLCLLGSKHRQLKLSTSLMKRTRAEKVNIHDHWKMKKGVKPLQKRFRVYVGICE